MTAKGNQDYKTVLRSVLKAELQLLLSRLAENGEESLVLTATTGCLPRVSPLCSKLAGEFFKTEAACIKDIGNKFQSFCQGRKVSQSQGSGDGNCYRKRKLSDTDDEVEDDNEEMEEVIVYVTEADGGGSEAAQRENHITSSGTSIVAGSCDEPGLSESFPQINVPSQSDIEAQQGSESQDATQVVIISQQNEDQSKTVWLDYMQSKSGAGNQETVLSVMTSDQSQEASEADSLEQRTTVDVTGSQVHRIQGTAAEKSQNVGQSAVSAPIGNSAGRVLVRNEATNRYMTLPVSSPSDAASSSKQGFTATPRPGQTKQELDNSAGVEKKPPATSFATYLSRLTSGNSVMIRAGEDSFEEIQMIYEPEIEDTTTKPVKKKRVKKEVSPSPVPTGISETIVTETGETVHVLKTMEEQEEPEAFDIPFEDCFDLLGKSARCLVCGKVMLKRNRRYHWRFHTGHKPYTCEYCHKQFYHPSNLKTHLFIHTARNR